MVNETGMFASESGGMGYGSVTAAPRADDTWLPPLMIPASKLYNLSSDTKEDQLQLVNNTLRSSLCLIGHVTFGYGCGRGMWLHHD